MDKGSVTFYLVNIGLVICALIITYVAALFIIGAGSVVLPFTDTDSSESFFWSIKNDTGGFFPTFSREDDGNLSGTFTFESTDDFLLMTLVDYNVTPFYYHGSYGRSHYIAATPVAPGQINSSGQFAVTGIREGLHDVSFVVIAEPYRYDSGPDRLYSFQIIHDQSSEVLVGKGTRSAPDFKNCSTSGQAEFIRDKTGSHSLLTTEPLSSSTLYSLDAKPGSVEEYYVNIPQRLIDDKYLNTSFAIIQLLDYEQVPVRHDSPDLVYYGWMNDSNSCSVRLSMKAPAEPGQYKITVLMITDPYDSMEITQDMKNYGAGKWLTGDFIDLNVAG